MTAAATTADFEIVVCNDEECRPSTLSAFISYNGFDDEQAAPFRALREGETIRDGGAGGEWSVTRKLSVTP